MRKRGGSKYGRITEVIAPHDIHRPKVVGYEIATKDAVIQLPASVLTVTDLNSDFQLSDAVSSIENYRSSKDDLYLKRDVLDEQVVDLRNGLVLRVNDIVFEHDGDNNLFVSVLDPGQGGVARRIGQEGMGDVGWRARFAHHEDIMIPWADAELLPVIHAGQPARWTPSFERLANLEASDLGAVLNEIDPAYRRRLILHMSVEKASEALVTSEESVQVSILRDLDPARAARIIADMGEDEAADVLRDMDRTHRDKLLALLDAGDRSNIAKLMGFRDNTAGGLMTSGYVAIPAGLSVADAMERIRSQETEAETIYVVYVVDADHKLLGSVSLRDLLFANPHLTIQSIMDANVPSVLVNASFRDVASAFEHYRLLAVPVIDAVGQLQGIITIDDTLEQLLPLARG